MNESLLKNENDSFQEQFIGKESRDANSLEGVSEAIVQVRKIESTQNISPDQDFGAAQIGERLNAGSSEIKLTDERIHFQERSKIIAEKLENARNILDKKIRTTLLPLATAFALSGNPAFAQETVIVQSAAVTPKVSAVVTQAEKRKLISSTDVFDTHSPLTQSSEMKKKNEQSMTSEELDTIRDLHKKTLEGKNEWMTISGRDKNGIYIARTLESGTLGGRVSFDDADSIVKNETFSHTHPVAVAENTWVGVSLDKMRSGESRVFIMPPSSVDIGQCMENAKEGIKQRVIDPRGVWEYVCDENHPFVQSREKIRDNIVAAVKSVREKYKVDKFDFEQAVSSSRDTHPASMIERVFILLEPKYPGIEKDGENATSEIALLNNTFTLSIFEYERDARNLTVDSSNSSDEENAEKILNFMKNAEKIGIYMSYTPFKEKKKRESTEE